MPNTAKLEEAIKYLRERKIYRADVKCAHKYDHVRAVPPPRFDVSRSSNPIKQAEV